MTLALDRVSVSLGSTPIVADVSATLDRGLVGLIGPNGAGKSSLVRAIVGLLPHDGIIAIDGSPVANMLPRDRARRIAYLPQGQAIHWPLSVARLVALGRLPHLAPLSRITAADDAAIERAMARTDTLALRDRPVDTLSGGERARVLLARALAVEAPILLADEPLAALDPAHQLDLMALLRAEADAGTLVVAVLHDLSLAARCDRLLLLDRGRLVVDDTPGGVLTPNRIAEVYGVTAWIGDANGIPIVAPLHRA